MAESSRFWNSTSVGDATEAPYDAPTEFADWVRLNLGYGTGGANLGIVGGSGSESTQYEGLQVTPNSPVGMSVLLQIGSAVVYGTEYENDSALTLTITANASGNPRIDTVILRKSWAAQTVRAIVLAGTPAASPVPPTLTQSAGVTWEIPIADIAVANGAVSISASNITPRAIPMNVSSVVLLDRFLNNSGATLETGNVVNFDSTADRAVNTAATTGLARIRRAGVVLGRYAAAAPTVRVLNRGVCYVRTSAAVTRGQYCNVNVSAATCYGSTLPTVHTIGEFLETISGAGLALAWIDAGVVPQFALLTNDTLAAPATTLLGSGDASPYNTLELEFKLRSELAATNENARLTFHAASIAANYYSYAANIANSTPAVTAIQNLAASVGILFNIPASTAPAGVFAYGRLLISNVLNNSEHHITGHYSYRVSNVNGGLAVVQVGGWYLNVNLIGNIAISTVGSNNLATGSYLNVYAKQTT